MNEWKESDGNIFFYDTVQVEAHSSTSPLFDKSVSTKIVQVPRRRIIFFIPTTLANRRTIVCVIGH